VVAKLASSGRDVAEIEIVAVRGDRWEPRQDRLAAEEPMEIRAAGPGQVPVSVAVTMRTPGSDEELAAGFLFTEGLIRPGAVDGVELADPAVVGHPDNVVTVRLLEPFDASAVASRSFVASASCGICGKASLDSVATRCDRLPPGPVVRASVVRRLPEALRAAQHVFDATGGLHGAGLFDRRGRLVAAREDVGRHNALDKLVGSKVLEGGIPLHDAVLLVSGRVSFEIVQKAAMAGIPIVCAVSAPTGLAVDTAEALGMTLVGFLRGDRFNVYTHPGRVSLEA